MEMCSKRIKASIVTNKFNLLNLDFVLQEGRDRTLKKIIYTLSFPLKFTPSNKSISNLYLSGVED